MKQLLDYLDYDFREGFHLGLMCFAILRNSTDNYLGLFIPSSSSTHRVRIAYRPL
jgi:hypothetical protein